MIYLIGGSPRGGKSILSRKLSRKLSVPYFSTDNIRPIVMPYFKSQERGEKFPSERMFDLNAAERFFLDNTPRQIINADLVESRTIWPGVKNLISDLLASKIDYIIEGVHLLPSLVKEFKSSRKVRILFLAKLDEEKIFRGFFKNNNNSDWLIDNIKDKEVIRLAAKVTSAYGNYFERETAKYNFKLINTEDSFIRQIDKAVRFLQSNRKIRL